MQDLLLVQVAHGIGQLLGHMEDDRLRYRPDASLSFADGVALVIFILVPGLIRGERPSRVDELGPGR